jgi:hypothetical protein
MFMGLVVLLAVGFFIISEPTVKLLSECIETFNAKTENNISRAEQEGWDKETVCRNGQPGAAELQACYSSVEAKNKLSLEAVFKITEIIRPGFVGGDADKAIELHNSSCSDYPETLVLR